MTRDDSIAINALPAQLQSGWDAVDKAALGGEPDEFAAACKAYNELFERVALPVLAAHTPNSLDGLRALRGFTSLYDTWPSPKYIRNVAHYQSFNELLWTPHSGFVREPTFPFGSLDKPTATLAMRAP